VIATLVGITWGKPRHNGPRGFGGGSLTVREVGQFGLQICESGSLRHPSTPFLFLQAC
jgi:hypothetical protein